MKIKTGLLCKLTLRSVCLLKKYFVALLIALFALPAPTFANDLEALIGPKKTVAVFVEFMQTMYGANEGMEIVVERIGDIIPTDKLSFIPLEKSMRELTLWKEDHLIPINAGYAMVRVPRTGLIEATQKLGAVDYIAAVIIVSAPPTYTSDIGVIVQQQTVVLDVSIMDPKSGEYLTDVIVAVAGRGKAGEADTVGNPAVFLKTLNSAIDQIKLDVSGL